jgi:hypothetical protein
VTREFSLGKWFGEGEIASGERMHQGITIKQKLYALGMENVSCFSLRDVENCDFREGK